TEIARLWSAYRQLENDAIDKESKRWWQIARALTFTALGTAMRRGELLALQWHDVELLEGRIRIHQALVKGRLTTPKSRAGTRTIELGSRTRQLLQDHWKHTPF